MLEPHDTRGRWQGRWQGRCARWGAEARRAVADLGLKALTTNGNWRGQNYDAIELYPFWQTISELGVPLYVPEEAKENILGGNAQRLFGLA